MLRPSALGALAIALTALVACTTGELGDPPNAVDAPQASTCIGIQPGASPMRRLTRTEYDNTVRDLLGDTSNPAASFSPEEQSLGFDNQASALTVSKLLAEQYLDAAEGIANRATRDMKAFVKCADGETENDCGARFVKEFGKRAFRHPLDDATAARFTQLFRQRLASDDFKTAIALVVEAMLQSPRFLYRVEFGTPDPVAEGVVPLDGYEMASRLSYMLWNTMPDDELFRAAEAGELTTGDALAAQASRMLDDPRAHGAVMNFHTQWLGLDDIDLTTKLPGAYPNYSDALLPHMKRETQAFLDYAVFDGAGDVDEMLTASYTMIDGPLATFYGVPGITGPEFVHAELDPDQRAGFLTQASVLSINAKPDQSSPIFRGKFVRERLLCQPLPPPPNLGVTLNSPPVESGKTTRERFKAHSINEPCSSCHRLMDPIGFGFENYDAVGAYRSTDQGRKVDATGDIYDSGDADGPFVGAVELAQRLAASEDVRGCIATQWFRFAYGRGEEPNECSLQQLKAAFKASGYNVKALIVALTQTDAFRYRPQVTAGK